MDHRGAEDYFERRAEEELAASNRATDERAAQSHRALAEEYRKRAQRSRMSLIEQTGNGTLARDFRIIP